MARGDSATVETPSVFGAPMTLDEAKEKLSSVRVRNMYAPILRQFLEAELPGVPVNRSSGPLAGKTVTTIKQGFDNALKAHRKVEEEGKIDDPAYIVGAGAIRVSTAGDNVVLLNTNLVGGSEDGDTE